MSLKWLVYHAVQAFDTEEVARAAASADVGRELLSNVRGLRVQHGTAEKLVRRLTDAFDDEALRRFPRSHTIGTTFQTMGRGRPSAPPVGLLRARRSPFGRSRHRPR